MERAEQTKAAIINRLKELGLEPFQPVSLYKIGTALNSHGYSVDDIFRPDGARVRRHDRTDGRKPASASVAEST